MSQSQPVQLSPPSPTAEDDFLDDFPDPKHPYDSYFWDKTPVAAMRRKIYFQVLFSGLLVTIFFMYAIFSIYWGALYKTPAHKLEGWVVDFDGDQVGQTVVQGLTGFASNIGAVTWNVKPASDFPNGPSELINLAIENKFWVAISINPNATGNLQAATNSIDPTYNSSAAITAFGNEARSENGYRSLVRPTVDGALNAILKQFTAQYVPSISGSSNFQTIGQNAPSIISAPIAYTIYNAIPFDIPVATAVTFVGLIYLLILSFFVVNMGNGAIHAAQFNHHLSLFGMVRLRLGTTFIAYFFISLFYSSVSAAFQVPFTRQFGNGGFVLFWLLNWIGMCAVGLPLESMLALITVKFVPFFLLTWIVTNISVCFFPIDVLPSVFRYGYAFPFYNVSEGIRCIIFGTKNTLGLNFGILIAWSAFSCLTLPCFQWVSRKLRTKRHRAARAEAIEKKVAGSQA